MKKVYAVIDTNVLVSAMLAVRPDSATVRVLEHLVNGDIVPMFNAEVVAEYREVLRRPKFGFSEDDIAAVIDLVVKGGVDSERMAASELVKDAKDVVFYEVAMSREDSYLVTGNIRHFPVSARVVTPNEFLDIIRELGLDRHEY